MQAYGWSLPANKPQGSGSVASTPTSEDSTSSSRIGANVPVPVPVYCRPLMEKEPGMKVSDSFLLSMAVGRCENPGVPVFFGGHKILPPDCDRVN